MSSVLYLALWLKNSCFVSIFSRFFTSYWQNNSQVTLLIPELKLFKVSLFSLLLSLGDENARFWIWNRIRLSSALCLQNTWETIMTAFSSCVAETLLLTVYSLRFHLTLLVVSGLLVTCISQIHMTTEGGQKARSAGSQVCSHLIRGLCTMDFVLGFDVCTSASCWGLLCTPPSYFILVTHVIRTSNPPVTHALYLQCTSSVLHLYPILWHYLLANKNGFWAWSGLVITVVKSWSWVIVMNHGCESWWSLNDGPEYHTAKVVEFKYYYNKYSSI